MKTGWKTTEFWSTVALNVGLLTSAIVGELPDKYAAIASAVSVAAYNVARALTKAGTANV